MNKLHLLIAALIDIRDNEGYTCPEYGTCTCKSCQSSYNSWAIASKALDALDDKKEDNQMTHCYESIRKHYKDKTYCTYFKDCLKGKNCDRALTTKVFNEATKQMTRPMIMQYLNIPWCFQKEEL